MTPLEMQKKKHGSEGSDARGSRDPVRQPVETSIAQRTAPDLVLWSDEPGGLLEPAPEERKARGKSVPMCLNPAEKAAHELTHTSFRNWCSYCVRARAADDPHHRQPHMEPEFPIIMTDYCFMQDAPVTELFTILDMLDVALGMMAAISVEEKWPATYVVLAVVEHLRAWGRKKVSFRIDGERAIRALGVAIQHARSEETVIECRPKYSSPSMSLVENMNKELCGLMRCFRIYLRDKAKIEITTESPLLPWLVRHFGWILSRYAVREDGRTGYSRLKGREYTAGIAIFGEAIWYKLPKTADLTKLDDRWRTAIWLGKSDRSDEDIIGLETGAVLARSVRRKVEGKRWNEKALKMVTGTPWRSGGETTVHHTSFGGKVWTNRRLRSMLPKKAQQHTERCRARFDPLCAGEEGPVEASAQEGQPAPPEPAAPNLVSTTTAARAGGVDTDAMETEDIELVASSQAPAAAAPIRPFVARERERGRNNGTGGARK